MSAADVDSASPPFAISTGRGKNSSHARNLVNVDTVGGYVRGLAALLRDRKSEVEGWWSVHQWEGLRRETKRWVASVGVAVDVDFCGELNAQGKETHVELSQEMLAKLAVAIDTWTLPGNIAHTTPRGIRQIFVFTAPVTDKDLVGAAMAGACDLVEGVISKLGLAARVLANGKRVSGLAVDRIASTDYARLFYAPGAIVGGVQRLAVVRVMRDEPTDPMTLAEVPGCEDWAEQQKVVEEALKAPNKETSFEQAVEAWNRDHPGDWPVSSGTCPICAHNGCFGQLPERPGLWSCFSSNHGDVGRSNADGTMRWGDALDVETQTRRKSRREVLLEDGYLVDGSKAAPPPEDFYDVPPPDNGPPREPDDELTVEEPTVAGAANDDGGKRRPTLRELCRAMRKRAKEPRVATGFPTIDRCTRGGFRSGGVVLGGAPGAGKTTLMVQIALDWARAGYQVTMLLADESPDGILTRMAMQLGFDRQTIEDGDDKAHDAFEEKICAIPTLALIDYDLDPIKVEQATADLLVRAGGRRCLLCADSLQTVSNGEGELMDRIDRVCNQLRAAAHAGVTVLATSELVKSFFANRKTAQDLDPMAAFKGSTSIPHLGELLLVLNSVKDSHDLFEAVIPKNRMGGEKAKFRLKLDPARAEFDEVPMPEERGAAQKPDAASTLNADIMKARTVLVENPGISGASGMAKKMTGMEAARQRAAIKAMREAGEILEMGNKNRPKWFYNPAGNDE